MTTHHFALFDTMIGTCGIAWHAGGITRLQLPETDPATTRARLRRRFPAADEAVPPAMVQRTIDEILALLRTEVADLSGAVLDMQGVPQFHQQVYAITRSIPPGATLTYGELALRLGTPGAARAVGQALGANPFPIIVPCHRVLAANGKAGGFSAHGGVVMKRRLLAIEGARSSPGLFDSLT
ncbi:MAG: methylated-DNA--[protein]-cysteine S-methyltransferase [Gemmatimonadales bacterium]